MHSAVTKGTCAHLWRFGNDDLRLVLNMWRGGFTRDLSLDQIKGDALVRLLEGNAGWTHRTVEQLSVANEKHKKRGALVKRPRRRKEYKWTATTGLS